MIVIDHGLFNVLLALAAVGAMGITVAVHHWWRTR